MYCEQCGTQIVDECKFCPHCGKSLSAEASPSHPASSTTPILPKPKKRWWLWLLWLILITLAIIYWIGSTVVMPEDIVLGQLESMRDGKLTEAYYEYTAKEFQKVTPLDQFKAYIKENTVLAKVKTFIVEDDAEEGGISTIRGFIVSEDGSSIEVVYKLILEEGKWKIFSFSPIVRGVKQEAPQASITKQLIEPVQTFLSNIQTPEFSQIYEAKVSKNFLENTPYERFQKYLEKNPVLASFSDYEIVEHQLNRGLGELVVLLNPDQEEIPVAFTVVKEEGEWKIFRISVGATQEIEALKTKELFEMVLIPYVKGSLQQLKAQNLDHFYHHNTSAEFREEVDFPLLQEFYTGFSLLSRYSELSVLERGEAGDLAWLDVELKRGPESRTVEFTLGMEEGDWKISGIKIFEKDSIQ